MRSMRALISLLSSTVSASSDLMRSSSISASSSTLSFMATQSRSPSEKLLPNTDRTRSLIFPASFRILLSAVAGGEKGFISATFLAPPYIKPELESSRIP